MLSAHEIGAQWSIWNKLVSGGDFDDMTSTPPPASATTGTTSRIPFTHDGSGNHSVSTSIPRKAARSGR